MTTTNLKTVFQVRRDTEANWLAHSTIVPASGEPCLTLDGLHAHQVKFGDGVKSWAELPYVGTANLDVDGKTLVIADGVVGIAGSSTATPEQSFRISADGTSLEWVKFATDESVISLRDLVLGKADASNVYTKDEVNTLVSCAFNYRGTVSNMTELNKITEPKRGDVYQVTSVAGFYVYDGDSWEDFGVGVDMTGYVTDEYAQASFEKVKYQITSAPLGTLVDYREKEIRVLCPEDYQWTTQSVGPTGDSTQYYIGFKAYAPFESVVSFKEDLVYPIEDNTMYYFDNNDFAGVDAYGRKYSIVWLPVAYLNEETGAWTYYGAKSDDMHLVGFDYAVKWYDASGIAVASDLIRINLTNDTCHDTIKPYYMFGVTADIPIAGEDNLGLVRSATGENMVTVNPDGTMEVKSMSMSRIVQAENETFIFDGGGATI